MGNVEFWELIIPLTWPPGPWKRPISVASWGTTVMVTDLVSPGLILVNSGEAWSGRECYSGQGPLGDPEKRAPLWEAQTAICGIVAGADACALLHPQAFAYVREAVREINAEPEEAV